MTPPPLPPRPPPKPVPKEGFQLSEGLLIAGLMAVGMVFAMLMGSYFIAEFHSRT